MIVAFDDCQTTARQLPVAVEYGISHVPARRSLAVWRVSRVSPQSHGPGTRPACGPAGEPAAAPICCATGTDVCTRTLPLRYTAGVTDATNTASTIDPAVIEAVAAILASSKSALFITGAGLSADSGLPTYRGIGGLYEDADTEEGIPIEVALSGSMLRARPEVAWRHIHRIEAACREGRFNRAHAIIAELEKRIPRVWVLTQNVDGFHHAAGSQNVIEIHGNVYHLSCTQCTWRESVADYSALASPPYCQQCGGLVRPEVVLFDELLPPAAFAELNAQLERGFDIVFSVGTTSVWQYITAPVVAAHRAGIPTVEINPGTTQVSNLAKYRIRAGARDAFEALWQAYLARTSADRA